MVKKYCFNILTQLEELEELTITELKDFIKELYEEKSSNRLSFVVFFSELQKSICVQVNRVKDINLIEEINKTLSIDELEWNSDISLSLPYLFKEDKDGEWWKEKKADTKWNSIIQKGPYFYELMNPYIPLGAYVIVDGKEIHLEPEEERIVRFYVNRIISESKQKVTTKCTEDEYFNRNFFNDLQEYLLTKEHKIIFSYENIKKIDWTPFIGLIEEEKIKNNALSVLEKQRKEQIKLEKQHSYGFAIIDGKKQKVGNFVVELQSIFYGRGDKSTRGSIKKQILPSDVTINVGKYDSVPEPPAGYSWKEVVNDHTSVWLAKWSCTMPGTSKHITKYILLSSDSIFKGKSDIIKYEKARKVQKYIESIREKYQKYVISPDITKQQIGTILYLIDKLGFRIGNEKDEDDVDTVGATTLLIENIIIEPSNMIRFRFYGKDSVLYDKKHILPPPIYLNFIKFIGKKKQDQLLFDVTSDDINDYLKNIDVSFSAKVFRTRLASETMYKELNKVTITEDDKKTDIKIKFNEANAKVAEILNHTRTASISIQNKIEKLKETLKELESKKDVKEIQSKKSKPIQTLIAELKAKIKTAEDMSSVAIGTSLANYIDPRLVIAWANRNNIDPSIIYKDKFSWAVEMINEDPDWDWLSSELIGNQELEPASKSKTVKKKVDKTKTVVSVPVKPPPLIKDKQSSKDVPIKDKPPSKDIPIKDKSPSKDVPIKDKPPSKDIPIKDKPPSKDIPIKDKPPSKDVPIKIDSKIKKGTSFDSKELYDLVGTKRDYQLLLEICENPEKYRHNFISINKDVLKWAYEYSKETIANGTSVIANRYIVEFYEKAYKKHISVLQSTKEKKPIKK